MKDKKFLCTECGKDYFDLYAVHDHIWDETGLPRIGGYYLHLKCLEIRLKRHLVISDFKFLNSPDEEKFLVNNTIRFAYEMGYRANHPQK